MRTIAPSAGAGRRCGAQLRARCLAPFVLYLSLLAACATSKGTIGAVIVQDSDTGRLFLREVPASLAAGQANLKPGDEILLIDGLVVGAARAAPLVRSEFERASPRPEWRTSDACLIE